LSSAGHHLRHLTRFLAIIVSSTAMSCWTPKREERWAPHRRQRLYRPERHPELQGGSIAVGDYAIYRPTAACSRRPKSPWAGTASWPDTATSWPAGTTASTTSPGRSCSSLR
jgi:hypothetical protein